MSYTGYDINGTLNIEVLSSRAWREN